MLRGRKAGADTRRPLRSFQLAGDDLRNGPRPGNPAGDQFVQLKVVLPPADSPKARELYEQMKRELPFDARGGTRTDRPADVS